MPQPRDLLSLIAYTAPTSSQQFQRSIFEREIDTLEFTTVAPGGMGELTVMLKPKDALRFRAELLPFSRLALQGPRSVLNLQHHTVWQGEITDPEYGINQQDGEYIRIGALGLSNALRDYAFPAQWGAVNFAGAVQSMFGSGYNLAVFLPIDGDMSAVLPQSSTTYNALIGNPVVFTNNTVEEQIAQLCTIDGTATTDTTWGVWPHSKNRDSAGIPTAQLQIHARDTSTTHYMVYPQDIQSIRLIPSAQRAYNLISVPWTNTAGATPAGSASAKDSRLAANGSQGAAPFRQREYIQSYQGAQTMNNAVAQNIANQYLALFKNITNTVEIVLTSVRNAQGVPIPLYAVWADHNIYVPFLSRRNPTMPAGPTAGQNQFYILETRYNQDSQGAATMTVQCDNYVDTVQSALARLQLGQDTQARQGSVTTGVVQASGSPVKGYFGASFPVPANPSPDPELPAGIYVSYPAVLQNIPTSITLSVLTTVNVDTSFGVGGLSVGSGNSQYNQWGFFTAWDWLDGSVQTFTTALSQFVTVGN